MSWIWFFLGVEPGRARELDLILGLCCDTGTGRAPELDLVVCPFLGSG